jgi:phage terminase Nu1 subunit (DNA packaging protein)
MIKIPKTVSALDLSNLLGITKRSVNELAERGTLERQPNGQFKLAETLQAYVLHREEVVAAENATGDYGKARAALYEERATMARMQRQKLEGELMPVGVVRSSWLAIVQLVRAHFLSMPQKLAPRLLGKTSAAEVETILRAAVYENLEDLAENVEIRKAPGANGDGEGLEDRL